MRAVLDANVLLSAALKPDGPPAQILRHILDGGLELVVCDQLLAEIERTLVLPRIDARLPPGRAPDVLALIRSEATVAATPADPPARSRDPEDDYLLALAESTRSILVTGDADLLELASEYPVWTVARILEALDAAG